jgi:hypothetical protein
MIVPTNEGGRYYFQTQAFRWDPIGRAWLPDGSLGSFLVANDDPVGALSEAATRAKRAASSPAPPYRWWHFWAWGYETTQQGFPIQVTPGGGLPAQTVPTAWKQVASFGNWEPPVVMD